MLLRCTIFHNRIVAYPPLIYVFSKQLQIVNKEEIFILEDIEFIRRTFVRKLESGGISQSAWPRRQNPNFRWAIIFEHRRGRTRDSRS